MDVTEQKVQQSVAHERISRSRLGAVSFVLFGIVICVYRFGTQSFDSVYLVLGLVMVAINAWRLSLGSDDKTSEATAQVIFKSNLVVITTSILSTTVFMLAQYENSLGSIHSSVALILCIGLLAGNVISFIDSRWIQFLYNFCYTVPPSAVILFKGLQNNSYQNESLIFILTLFGLIYYQFQYSKILNIFKSSYRDKILVEEESEKYKNLYLELKKTQTELLFEKAKNFNSERLASIHSFASGLAHEINNPLAISNGQVFKLRKLISKASRTPDPFELRDIVNKQMMEPMEKIISINTKISQIIRGLQDLSSENTDQEIFQKTNIKDVIDLSLIFLKEKMKVQGVELEIIGSHDIIIEAQINSLTQSLYNILKNSMDAVETAEVKKISITIEEDSEKVSLKVKDSGSGIPENIQVRIFDPFFSTHEVGQGAGLGLSIAQGILSNHQGSIKLLESQVGCTVFCLSIPKNQLSTNSLKVS